MKIKKELVTAFVLSAAVCFMFFVYAPLELYFTNKDEFWYDVGILFPVMACVFLIFTVICCLGFFIVFKCNTKLLQGAILLMFIAFLCSYVQGNYLVKYLPVMDGRAIDWSLYSNGRLQSVILWIVVISVVLLLHFKLGAERVCGLIRVVSICMILMFGVTLVTLCISNHGLEKKENLCVTTDYELTMSKDRNFIILLVDTLDGGAFSDLVIGNVEREAIFDDFTYYDNTMSAYPLTKYNVPLLLSGMWFKNNTSNEEYFEEVMSASPLFAELESRGYTMDLYETDIRLNETIRARFENIGRYTRKVSSYSDFARWQVMLVGMKYAPFDLKRFSFVNPNAFELLRVVEGDGEAFRDFNMNFYDLVNERDIQYREGKNFKFIHLWGAHPPYEYDKDMNYLSDGGTFTESIEACITLSEQYLIKLRDSDAYDNSVIIILGDHGNCDYYEDSNLSQHPALLIKGIGEKHDFQVNHRAVSFDDMQDAYVHLLDGGDGRTVFDSLPTAESRRFLWYSSKDESHMVEYEQTGDAGDMSTMIPTGREYNVLE